MAEMVAVAARFEIEVRDLEYQRHDGTPLLARLYRPIGAATSSPPFPALIDVHGGAWASGDRLNNAPLDEALAKSGIVVLAIDFRMPPQSRDHLAQEGPLGRAKKSAQPQRGEIHGDRRSAASHQARERRHRRQRQRDSGGRRCGEHDAHDPADLVRHWIQALRE